MYPKYRLSHSSFSEYNILVSLKNFFIIDVGQWVERDNQNEIYF